MRLKILTLSCLLALSLATKAANEKKEVTQVIDAVELTTDVDYIITNSDPFTTAGSVNIVNTDHAVVILSSLKPSQVLSGSVLSKIFINGEAAVDGTNCQVKMYGRGSIIFP